MPSAKVTSKGQITIPAAVRKAMGLKQGSKVYFSEEREGEFVLRRAKSLMELEGCLKGLVAPMTVEEMDRMMMQRALELDEASKTGVGESAERAADSEAA
jgi:AbrB family looped-hinge helix DNA binding protein